MGGLSDLFNPDGTTSQEDSAEHALALDTDQGGSVELQLHLEQDFAVQNGDTMSVYHAEQDVSLGLALDLQAGLSGADQADQIS